jgi:hypothetical protein
MRATNLLRTTAVLEGGMALPFLLLPSLPSELLFGQAPQTPLGLILGRFVGALMLSLAIVCWCAGNHALSPLAHSVVKTMLFYNAAATALLLYARMGLELSGILLWFGVVVHLVLGTWCIVVVQRKEPRAP